MPNSIKYIVYLAFLHLAIVIMAWYFAREEPIVLFCIELGALASAYVAYRLYRSLIAPLQLLSRGAAALADKDFSLRLLPTGSQEMDRLVGVYNQMIEQLRSERVASKQKEAFLDRVVNSARLGVAVLDFDGRLTSMNEWLVEKAGSEAFDAAVLQPALHLPPGPKTASRIRTGPGNRRYRLEQGTFQDRGFERRFLFIQDVTTELLDAEKRAYGRVIRMMAHEVNNSNGAVESVLESLRSAAEAGDPDLAALSQEYLPIVIQRSANMTAFMRRFADVIRLPAPDLRPLDLNEVLRQTGNLLQPRLQSVGIEVVYQLSAQPVIVRADRPLLEQVIINGVTNARESIGQHGMIRISSDVATRSFAIADDGPGIPNELNERLFTPFFSSKPDGQGVGLTLIRDVLESHGAEYGMATEADGWTRLRVKFSGG